jgi:hypothetical protein
MNPLILGLGGALANTAIDALLGGGNLRLLYNDNFSIAVPCTLRERHNDQLQITDHPVEIGAQISDHAFVRPMHVDLEIVYGETWTESIKDFYAKFLTLQSSRELFNIVTGKRAYSNMLVEHLESSTDKRTENILILTLRCRQVIIVETRTTQPSKDKQANPGKTAAPTNKGSLQTFSLKNPTSIVAVPI